MPRTREACNRSGVQDRHRQDQEQKQMGDLETHTQENPRAGWTPWLGTDIPDGGSHSVSGEEMDWGPGVYAGTLTAPPPSQSFRGTANQGTSSSNTRFTSSPLRSKRSPALDIPTGCYESESISRMRTSPGTRFSRQPDRRPRCGEVHARTSGGLAGDPSWSQVGVAQHSVDDMSHPLLPFAYLILSAH